MGFTLSPVLWRKLPGSRSAGRVQSVALRLICEREAEIEAVPRPRILDDRGADRDAGRRALHRAADPSERQASSTSSTCRTPPPPRPREAAVEAGAFSVGSSRAAPGQAQPAPPFTTSTLQQEASRKLGFGAQQTMRVAQQLYEGVDIGGETVGLITYMRTDGVQMAREAIARHPRPCEGRLRRQLPARRPARIQHARPRTRRKRMRRSARPMSPARPADVGRALNHDQRAAV